MLGNWWGWRTAAVTALALAGPVATAWGQAGQPPRLGSRLRPADGKAATVLALGLARSATFRVLAATIERSDLLVYVETTPMARPGGLQFLTSAAGCRHLRITVRVPNNDADLVAWLGHELQHAVELADAPEVVDQPTLLRFYERLGHVSRKNGTAETGGAQEAWARILREVRYGRRKRTFSLQ